MLWFDQEILGSPVEGVEVNISCQTEDLGNVTPTLGLTRLGLAAQTWAGVETLLHIAIVLDVLTTDLVGYHSTQSVTYWYRVLFIFKKWMSLGHQGRRNEFSRKKMYRSIDLAVRHTELNIVLCRLSI